MFFPAPVPLIAISPDMSLTSFTSSGLEITPLLSTSKMRNIFCKFCSGVPSEQM